MNITDEAVEAALKSWFGVDYENGTLSVVSGLIDVHLEMRAALEAALQHMRAARAPGRRYDDDPKNWEGWTPRKLDGDPSEWMSDPVHHNEPTAARTSCIHSRQGPRGEAMKMREKIARAIDSRPFSDNWQESFLFEAWRGEAEAKAYRSADAVLDALMSPSANMIVEGIDADENSFDGLTQVATIFTAMIQAAKEGG